MDTTNKDTPKTPKISPLTEFIFPEEIWLQILGKMDLHGTIKLFYLCSTQLKKFGDWYLEEIYYEGRFLEHKRAYRIPIEKTIIEFVNERRLITRRKMKRQLIVLERIKELFKHIETFQCRLRIYKFEIEQYIKQNVEGVFECPRAIKEIYSWSEMDSDVQTFAHDLDKIMSKRSFKVKDADGTWKNSPYRRFVRAPQDKTCKYKGAHGWKLQKRRGRRNAV